MNEKEPLPSQEQGNTQADSNSNASNGINRFDSQQWELLGLKPGSLRNVSDGIRQAVEVMRTIDNSSLKEAQAQAIEQGINIINGLPVVARFIKTTDPLKTQNGYPFSSETRVFKSGENRYNCFSSGYARNRAYELQNQLGINYSDIITLSLICGVYERLNTHNIQGKSINPAVLKVLNDGIKKFETLINLKLVSIISEMRGIGEIIINTENSQIASLTIRLLPQLLKENSLIAYIPLNVNSKGSGCL